MTYGSTERFATALDEVAARYAKKAKPITALPTLRNLRLALNVAAADMRPLVVVRGKDVAEAARLESAVAKIGWSERAVGTRHYVVLDAEEAYEGLEPELGVTVVQPDPYGRGGKVLAHAKPGASAEALGKSLDAGVAAFDAEDRDHDDHVREARLRGIRWETAQIDRGLRAREVSGSESSGRGSRGRRRRRALRRGPGAAS